MSEALKKQIKARLLTFAESPLREAGTNLLNTLGYHSRRTGNPGIDAERHRRLRQAARTANAADKLRLDDWNAFHFLFQVTDEEMHAQQTVFERQTIDDALMHSYIFATLKLSGDAYTRTQLVNITRFLNKQLPQPIMVMFHYGNCLTLAIINRRWDKRENPAAVGRDRRQVLEKVTLIKDINLASPHRAHLDILAEFSLDSLVQTQDVHNFDTLHKAWEGLLNTEALNRKFYGELYAWYQWAVDECRFPDDANQVQVIRLITRLLFIWFLKEKGLVPAALFEKASAATHLKEFSLETSAYYQAILQNLFFATLNTPIDKRAFSTRSRRNHRNSNKYRYADLLRNPDAFLASLKQVPFVNGGLFDCLDTFEGTRAGGARIDCFTEDAHARQQLHVPAKVFFDENAGLFPLFSHYKFTVEENTPVEQEVALDPELLGKVFENLLAAHTPETGTTARKQTGSYYTPRDIVDYMVDEALVAVFKQKCTPTDGDAKLWDERLRYLLDYAHAFDDANEWFDADETEALVRTISALNILDPAVGSGAFPMGMLHKLTLVLRRLDADNSRWERLQKERAQQRATAAFDTTDDETRPEELLEIDATFRRYRDSDFGRKLYLIQNCIYGVDIQPVACQIAKLRFFISLAIEQEPDNTAENFGIRPLPNLETRFLAANTLLGLTGNRTFTSSRTQELEGEIVRNGERHFHAITRAQKLQCQRRDKALREALAAELREVGMPAEDAEHIASWDRYDTHAVADWFSPERMFGIREGFDIVIGNPPYIVHRNILALKPALKTQFGDFFISTADISVYFYKRGEELLRDSGILAYICTNKFLRSGYGKNLRHLLLTEMSVKTLLDFGSVSVFEASVDTCITLVERRIPSAEQTFQAATLRTESENFNLQEAFQKQAFPMKVSQLTSDEWTLTSAEVLTLLKKLQNTGTAFEQYVGGRFYIGVITSHNKAYVIDASTREDLIAADANSRELIRPLLRGKNTAKWKTLEVEQHLILIKSSTNREWPWSDAESESDAERIFEETYPAIYQHLSPYREELIARSAQGKFWWEIRSCDYYDVFDNPKIVYPDISSSMRACYDTTGAMCLQSNYVLSSSDPSLLGILNSKLFDWYARHKFQSLNDPWAGGGLRFIAQYMRHAPIADMNLSQQAELSRLVSQILAAPDNDNVRALERQIDAVVYQLYGLSSAEIALIEQTYRDAGMAV